MYLEWGFKISHKNHISLLNKVMKKIIIFIQILIFSFPSLAKENFNLKKNRLFLCKHPHRASISEEVTFMNNEIKKNNQELIDSGIKFISIKELEAPIFDV